MKIIRQVIFFLYLILILHSLFLIPVFAGEANNKFGIHLAQPHYEELQRAAELVNSNGGKWGYVTLVIQENDRNRQKWQEIFDKMRELHLIPIIRLATQPQGEVWRRPEINDARDWADFLNSLNWVVKERYIILFNEPNHGSEWGGTADPKNYGEVALNFAQKLKEKNKDFYIMLAGLDASAPHYPSTYFDEELFIKNVFSNETIEQWNNLLSGLSSHSYPNPAFAGSVYDRGRKSIRGYEWELDLFRSMGIKKDLPVFITETGWSREKLGEAAAAENFRIAFSDVWGQDNRVQAVTPFVLDYQGEPFLDFSWRKLGSSDYYSQYYAVRDMAKAAGQPEQIDEGKLKGDLPAQLITASSYHFRLSMENRGQAVWDKDEGYSLRLTEPEKWSYFFSDLEDISPYREAEADFFLKTNGYLGRQQIEIGLYHGPNLVATRKWAFTVQPLPGLKITADIYPKLRTTAKDFELQIFDDKDGLLYKKSGVEINKRQGKVGEIQNIVPGKKYRVVLLKPYYLPRQEIMTFHKGENSVRFKVMFPLDFDRNGSFSFNDIGTLFKNPKLFSLFIP